jgi:hypothetical protein
MVSAAAANDEETVAPLGGPAWRRTEFAKQVGNVQD